LVRCLLARTCLPLLPSPSCQLLNGVGHKLILTMVYLSSTIGRSVEPLNERSQDEEDLVSRSLSNMRDEDLQMLSVISRRTLNRLDKRAASERDADSR
jgi:hypothetical protein